MPTQLRMIHVIECNVDSFWTVFLDEDFNSEIFLNDLGFPNYRVLERADRENVVRQRLEVTPKLKVPPAVANVIGQRFTYVEVGEFDKNVREYRFELLPPQGILGDKASTRGVAWAEPTPDGKTRRIVDVSFEVRLFGIGKMLESVAARSADEGYAAHAEMANKRLRTMG